ncbi:hypothetical protein CCUS01_13263 [Colletotrichum cuscutae]|uniref:Ankyrin repeat protein n=1 Tax=Colletotrichum cuscutae TaxID=1209917 RepID=A0AAI9YCB8_9PEZI|nr:hypothetical protein CCUS01_13263 [Colletotrichum cuscutae]
MESKDEMQRTPLHWASKSGNLDCIRKLLDKGADVEPRDRDGMAALHFAAESDYLDVVEVLLQQDPNTNSVAHKRQTPLMLAARAGQRNVLEVLVQHGAKCGLLQGAEGSTALEHAIKGCRSEVIPHVIKTLVRLGAKVDARGKAGRTPLLAAASDNHIGPALPAMKQLLDCGAELEATDLRDRIAWELASCWGRDNLAESLLSIRRSRGLQGLE